MSILKKATFTDTIGTSFKRAYVKASVNELVRVIGLENIYGPFKHSVDDKVHHEWAFYWMGGLITIYDYKEHPKDANDQILFHVGGRNIDDKDIEDFMMRFNLLGKAQIRRTPRFA